MIEKAAIDWVMFKRLSRALTNIRTAIERPELSFIPDDVDIEDLETKSIGTLFSDELAVNSLKRLGNYLDEAIHMATRRELNVPHDLKVDLIIARDEYSYADIIAEGQLKDGDSPVPYALQSIGRIKQVLGARLQRYWAEVEVATPQPHYLWYRDPAISSLLQCPLHEIGTVLLTGNMDVPDDEREARQERNQLIKAINTRNASMRAGKNMTWEEAFLSSGFTQSDIDKIGCNALKQRARDTGEEIVNGKAGRPRKN